MRVTDSMIFEQATARTAIARERMQDAVTQASSGKRVEHPGDDPAAAGEVVLRQAAKERFETIREVAGRAHDELGAADGAFGHLNDLVTRARELAIQLANDTYSATERAGAAQEIEGLYDEAIAILNTKVGSRFIFGGNLDGAPPFADVGGVPNYLGDAGQLQVEIAPGQFETVGVRADQYLKGAGGGVDVLQSLKDLSTALSTNNLTGIQSAIQTLDAGTDQISQGRTFIGDKMNVVGLAMDVSRTVIDNETAGLSRARDVDIFKAVSQLGFAERALDAALTASAKSFDLTLLNRI